MFEQLGCGWFEERESVVRVILAADFDVGKSKKEKSFLGRRFCACMI